MGKFNNRLDSIEFRQSAYALRFTKTLTTSEDFSGSRTCPELAARAPQCAVGTTS